jgi:hypothetical protein
MTTNELISEHARLDKLVAKLSKKRGNQTECRELKKRKLLLKSEISERERRSSIEYLTSESLPAAAADEVPVLNGLVTKSCDTVVWEVAAE